MPTIYNWVPSTITEERLKEFFIIGFLPAKTIMSYRAPDPEEERPNPRDGEVIVLIDHMNMASHCPAKVLQRGPPFFQAPSSRYRA